MSFVSWSEAVIERDGASSPQVPRKCTPAGWKTAIRVEGFVEFMKGNNAAPPVKTIGLMTYDAQAVYVAFIADDPRPAQIRAPFVDRDIFPLATRLRWVQSPAVGVGSLMFPELLASDVLPSIAAIPGNAASLFGSGFIEGGTTVRFGSVDVIDGGPGPNDGLDVRAWNIGNGRIDVTVPASGSGPVTVFTIGGQSNSISP